MTAMHNDLEHSLRQFGAAYRAGVRRRVLVQMLWIGLSVILVLLLLDAVLALPMMLRAFATLLFIPAWAAAGALLYRGGLTARSYERMVVRFLESANPAMGNTLVNAIDFRDQMRAPESGPANRDLMEREIRAAGAMASSPELAAQLRRPDISSDARWLALVGAVALICAALFWPVFRAVVPRFIAFAGDHPPYHPTRLDVEPEGASVEYGDNLDVKVTRRGPIPRRPELVLCDTRGAEVARLPLYESSPGIYLQTLEHLTTDRVYFAAMEGGRSPRYSLVVARHPRISTAQVRCEFPQYPRLQAQNRFLVDRTIRSYRGTRATFSLTANRPLQSGSMKVGETTIAMERTDDPLTVRASFLLASNEAFEASVTDTEGGRAREPYRGKVELLPDLPPEIAMVEPGTDSFATPDAKVPLRIEARDDLGIRRVAIFRNHNASADFRKILFEDAGALPFANVFETLDFQDLGVKPGDVVDYYASATDCDPLAPHTISTKAYSLRIITDDEFKKLMQARMTAADLREKYETLRADLASLVEQQEELAKQMEQVKESAGALEVMTDGDRARLADLADQQEKLAAETAELSGQFRRESESKSIFDVERDFKKGLEEFSKRVAEASRAMRESSAAMKECQGPRSKDARDQSMAQAGQKQKEALEKMGQSGKQYDEGIQAASREIEQVFALYEDAERFMYLLERQKSLQRQSRYYAEVKDPDLDQRVRLKELADEQKSIREELASVGEALLKHAQAVETEYPRVANDARGIAAQIKALDIVRRMDHAAMAFNEIQPLIGHRQARAAYEAMLSMVAQCKGANGGKDCEMRLRLAMNMELGNTFDQLASALNFGEGGGGAGGLGSGLRGQGGGMQVAYNVYGNSELPEATKRGRGLGRRSRNLPPEPEAASAIAADSEDVVIVKDAELKADGTGEEGVMMEYENLINAYFKTAAEE